MWRFCSFFFTAYLKRWPPFNNTKKLSICQDHLGFFSLHVFSCQVRNVTRCIAHRQRGDPICLRRFVFCPSAIHHIISALQHCSYPRPPTSKCSFAAFLPALVGLVTLQSVHATLSRNCRTASVSTIQPPSVTQPSISHTYPNVSSYIWFLWTLRVIKLSPRPMSRCLVNTAPSPAWSLVSAATPHPLLLWPHCYSARQLRSMSWRQHSSEEGASTSLY